MAAGKNYKESEVSLGRFAILNADDPAHRALWLRLWKGWSEREVFAHPDFIRLFCGEGDRALCAVSTSSNGQVMFPFVLRAIHHEPWMLGAPDEVFDISVPFGYGGPFLISGTGEPDTFWDDLTQWAQRNNVVSGFLRLSLFTDQLLPVAGETVSVGYNVVRRLDLPPEQLWMNYRHKVRKNVKRARARGLQVEVDYTGAYLDDFLAVYFSTLDRRGAEPWYYHDRDFFDDLIKSLSGQFAFFHCVDADHIVSSELVLISSRHVYSYLGGTLPGGFPLRANDLLKHAIVLWAIENNKETYVLGGDRDGGGVLRYKHAFAPDGLVPFSIATFVFDQHQYGQLSDRRRAYEKRIESEWRPRPGFFPSYRA